MSAPAPAAPVAALWRAVLALGGLAVVGGGLATVVALADGVGFAAAGVGSRVWWLHHANPLGGVLIAAAGLGAIAAGARRSPPLGLLSAAGMLALGLAVPLGQAMGANVLGGTASTLGLCVGIGGGVLACALTARAAQR